MTDSVTIRGFVATTPTQKFLPNGNVPVTNFRVASTPRWFDAGTGTWKEGTTNWYTVNSFRSLAYNSARSLHVGHPVLVTGRLRVKQFERNDGSQGMNIEIDATSIGHDLNFGLANFARITDRKPEVDEINRRFDEQVQGERQLEGGTPGYQPPAGEAQTSETQQGAAQGISSQEHEGQDVGAQPGEQGNYLGLTEFPETEQAHALTS